MDWMPLPFITHFTVPCHDSWEWTVTSRSLMLSLSQHQESGFRSCEEANDECCACLHRTVSSGKRRSRRIDCRDGMNARAPCARRAFPSWDTTGRLVAGAKMNNDGIAWVVGVIKVMLGLSACRVGAFLIQPRGSSGSRPEIKRLMCSQNSRGPRTIMSLTNFKIYRNQSLCSLPLRYMSIWASSILH